MDPTFSFRAELWRWSARESATWVFVTVPVDVGEEIEDLVPDRRGFGSIKVRARIGPSNWDTSIFPSSESGSFVLPLKKQVRQANKLDIGDTADVEIDLLIT